MRSATVTSKGQVTIPADIRETFRIVPGDRIVFFESLTGELSIHVSRPRVGAGRGSIVTQKGEFSRDAIGQAVAEGVAERLARSTKAADKVGSKA